MIGVDSNVLVRVLVGDAPEQSRRAVAFLSQRSQEDPAYVSEVVLVEIIWVLQRAYGYTRDAVLVALTTLFESANLLVARQELMQLAIRMSLETGADLADSVIAALAVDAGAAKTVTFDRDAARRIPGMELLK
ncbi:MAG TPA: type II toxin-antitoxin system VapC family toxin [Devosia sp.]|nr:type II toxin-antitoxin system VapC family toxin [Devosia sp.]